MVRLAKLLGVCMQKFCFCPKCGYDLDELVSKKIPDIHFCPNCGKDLEEANKYACNIAGCISEAIYEGWHKAIGPFGVPTGLIEKIQVCEKHKKHLMGFQK